MNVTDVTYAHRLDAEDKLASYRDRFVVDDSALIYLDGNSLGRLPRAARDQLRALVDEGWGRRLIRGWNEGWFDLPEQVGGKIARLLGAQPEEVIVADSTSVNLYKLATAALGLRPERHKIVTDDLNFPSDLYILQGVAARGKRPFSLQIVPSSDGIHGSVDALAAAIDADTALVTLSLTTFKSGYTYDIIAVTELAHQAGALVLWDLSHAAGAVAIDLETAGADFAVGCTYKYLNGGPGAPAFLYVRRSWQEQVGNPIAGWMGQRDLFAFDPAYVPAAGIRRFLTGTPPILSLAAIEPGVDLLLEAGMARVRAKSVHQTEYLIDLWREWLQPLGFRLNSPIDPARRGSHVSLGHEAAWGIDQALIHEMGVLPDYRRPDNLRLGIAPLYTSFLDIHTAVSRLRTVVTEGRHEKYADTSRTVT